MSRQMKFISKSILLVLLVFFSAGIAYSQNTATDFRNFLNEHDYEKAGELIPKMISENPKDYDLLISAGDVYYELERYQDAFNTYTKAKELKPKESRVFAKLGRTLINLSRPGEAITELKKAIDSDKKNVELILELAAAYIANGNLEQAEINITNARSIDSKRPDVYVMLGKLYFEQKIWELARSNYEEALKLDSKNLEVRRLLAEVYWKLAVAADSGGDIELMNEYLNRSLDECNIALKENDKDATTWRLKAQIHFNANQKLEAAQAYNKFIQLRPNNYKERWRLAELLATSGVCDSARPHLLNIIKSTHDDITDSIKIRAELLLASCYYKDKNYSEANGIFKSLRTRITLAPEDLQVYAISSLFNGDTNDAVILFKELFKVNPEESCNFMYLVANQILKPQKKYAEMIEILEQRLNINACDDDNNAFCYYTIGTGYFELKEAEKAIAALKKSLEVNPTFYWSNIYLGDIYYSQKDIAAGEAQFYTVINAVKTEPNKYKNELNAAFQKVASAKLDAKKYSEIEKVSKEWVSLLPENNEFGHLFLAIAYQGQGKAEQAKSEYREVLKVNPENKTAKDNLRALSN